MGRFETKWLSRPENLIALADLPGQWIDKVRQRRGPKTVILDMDSTKARPRPAPGQACMGLCSVKPDLSIRGELAVAHANACYTLVFGRSSRTSTMMQ